MDVKEPRRGLVTAPSEQKIEVWETHTGKLIRPLGNYQSWQASFRVSPDNRTLAGWFDDWSGESRTDWETRSTGRSLHFWDTLSGKSLPAITKSSTNVGAFAFSSTGRVIACTENSLRPVIRLKEVCTGSSLREIAAKPAFQGGLAISPNGRLLAFSQEDGAICLLDLAGDKCARELKGHTGRANSLDFTSDGRRLLSTSRDGTIITWDVAGLEVATPNKGDGLDVDDLNKLWQALAEPDAAKAYPATRTLQMIGIRAVDLLASNLPDDLGNDLPASHVRAIRAIEVLERIASKEACELLAKLAGNPLYGRVREEAALSLERLGVRANTK